MTDTEATRLAEIKRRARHDRDVNAARNILAVALSTQRPVEGSRGVVI